VATTEQIIRRLGKLKSTLLTSGLQQKDQPLFQVINALIDAQIDASTDVVAITGGGSSTGALSDRTYLTATLESTNLPNSRELIAGTNVTFDDTTPNARIVNASGGGAEGAPGAPGINGIDGEDGFDGFPGPMGPQGNTGPIGPAGITGSPGIPGLDGLDGEDAFPIPGPTGPRGTTGATGPAGLQGIPGPPGFDAEEPEYPYIIPGERGATGATGSSGGMTTLKTTANQTINAGAGTFVDITNLTFPVTNGVDYAFYFYIVFRSALTTTGWKAAVNHPGGTVDHFAHVQTVANGAAGLTTWPHKHNTGVDDMTLLTSTVTANVDLVFIIQGRYQCTANGTFAARFANELAANTDIVVQKGSWGYYF
jgi:hypothetical protein